MRGIHSLPFPLKLSCPLVFFRCDVILLVTYCLAGESLGSVSPSTIESTGKNGAKIGISVWLYHHRLINRLLGSRCHYVRGLRSLRWVDYAAKSMVH